MTKRELMISMTEATGGEVSEGRFIERPGVAVMNIGNGPTPEAVKILTLARINRAQDPQLQLAELAARLTYFSFPKDNETLTEATAFHDMLQKQGHTSPYDTASGVGVLFAGVSLETALELIANKGNIGRLSSSRTQAMNDPLFIIEGSRNDKATQRRRINAALNEKREILREMAKKAGYMLAPETDPLSVMHKIVRVNLGLSATGPLEHTDTQALEDATERINRQDPCSKALYVIDSKPTRQWQWQLAGRLSEAPKVEIDLLGVLCQTAGELNKHMPHCIKRPTAYLPS